MERGWGGGEGGGGGGGRLGGGGGVSIRVHHPLLHGTLGHSRGLLPLKRVHQWSYDPGGGGVVGGLGRGGWGWQGGPGV